MGQRLMLGAAGAMLCMAAGTALGVAFRERRYARLRLLESEAECLCRMRLMLIEERLGLCQLLEECACGGDDAFAKRLLATAAHLRKEPLLTTAAAYERACKQIPAAYEAREERAALGALFCQLGTGTATMREQAVAGCLRRLRPMTEDARKKAEAGGRLSMQLGLLLGLMTGIALW